MRLYIIACWPPFVNYEKAVIHLTDERASRAISARRFSFAFMALRWASLPWFSKYIAAGHFTDGFRWRHALSRRPPCHGKYYVIDFAKNTYWAIIMHFTYPDFEKELYATLTPPVAFLSRHDKITPSRRQQSSRRRFCHDGQTRDTASPRQLAQIPARFLWPGDNLIFPAKRFHYWNKV